MYLVFVIEEGDIYLVDVAATMEEARASYFFFLSLGYRPKIEFKRWWLA